MTRFLSYAAIVICLGATAMLANSERTVNSKASVDAQLNADGAFRDGLYLGRLAAASTQRPRPEVGRWSADPDRGAFTAGYRRGDNEALAREEP
ncbi:MAG TPA: hypothetical protein VMU26_14200 [Candidatus Polarisedimenticolia bacterium]|nr:hypothetical protein [Candidatus Polarisedimenticolia bacterium]